MKIWENNPGERDKCESLGQIPSCPGKYRGKVGRGATGEAVDRRGSLASILSRVVADLVCAVVTSRGTASGAHTPSTELAAELCVSLL